MQSMRRLSHTLSTKPTTIAIIATINIANEFGEPNSLHFFCVKNEIFVYVKSVVTEITICSGEKCALSNVAT